MKIALLSAGVNGDNSGDAMIEDAVRRILVAQQFALFPLLKPLTHDQIREINATDCAVICGTNLYQKIFACNLDIGTMKKIRVPIIPLGIGSSAPINEIPKMTWWQRRTVRFLHTRCKMGSVRDPASLRFLRSIGVTNVALTGCPVLFHGLKPPNFDRSGSGLTLSIRARLLHTKGDRLWETEEKALDDLCKRYAPLLVLQSPYDLESAKTLSKKFGLQISYDSAWQAPSYIKIAQEQRASVGFRLHYGMLSLSYGKPAYLIAHDSRSASFCDLMNLSYYDIRTLDIQGLSKTLDILEFDGAAFTKRWKEMAQAMICYLKDNGLQSRILS